MQNRSQQIFTIPNILSFIRILLIPVCALMYLKAESSKDYIWTGWVLAVSCITDLFDGLIARKFNMITTLGKILDPVADKGTQFTMILCLAVRIPVLWAVVPLFAVKEGFQFFIAAYHYKRGKMLNGALLIGKITTAVLFVSMIALVVFSQIPHGVVLAITCICIALLAASFISYIMAYYGKNKKIQDIK